MLYKVLLKFLVTATALSYSSCSIDGSFHPSILNTTRPGEDPCNPLYWYPREIPEYCFHETTRRPKPFKRPIPMPIPIPVPPPVPPLYPQPIFPAPMMPQVYPQGGFPVPIMAPSIPLPFGIPIVSTNPMIPVAGIQVNPAPPAYPAPPALPVRPAYPTQQYPVPPVNSAQPYPIPPTHPIPPPYPLLNHIGMVPGLHGMVAPDGGINILPFSDVYADMLEKHKQKMIRRRLQKFLDEYDGYPWKGKRSNR